MPVVNQQTLTSHATFTAAIAGIPAGAWPVGGYELRADDDGPYAETITVSPATVTIADKGNEELTLSGRLAGTLVPTTVVDADPAPAAGDGVYVWGVNDVTIKELRFSDVHSSNTFTNAAVRIGERAGGTNLPAHRITVTGCILGQLTLPAANAGVYVAGQGVACDDIQILGGDPTVDIVPRTQVSGSRSWAVYAQNVTQLTIEYVSFLQHSGTLSSAAAIELINTDDVFLHRMFHRLHETQALRVEASDRVRVVNSQFQECNDADTNDEYIELDNVDGFAAWNNTFAHLDGADPLRALIYVHNSTAGSVVHCEGNIFYLAGTGATHDVYRFGNATDLGALQTGDSSSNCFHLVDAAEPAPNTPGIARIDGSATDFETLTAWRAGASLDPSGSIGAVRSVDADPQFEDVTPGSGADLRIGTGSGAFGIAAKIWSASFGEATVTQPMLTDFFGSSRSEALNDAGFHEVITITTVVVPATVEKNGGYRVGITGLSIPDGSYRFHLGPKGTVADPICYAGSYGDVNDVAVAGGSGVFVTPPLPSGGPYSVYIDGFDATSGSAELVSGAVTYVHKNHRSSLYALRSLLLPWWKTGPRQVEKEPLQS